MKKLYLQTFGCQMNEYDSQVVGGILENQGFQLTQEESKADVVLMNTCSVREHAEDRVYSRLGMLGKAKKTKPDLIVGLMGCMVEEHREQLFRRFPQLDLMIGTRNIKELPSLIEEVRKTRKQTARIKQDGLSIEYTDLIKRTSRLHAWLPIMTGCNKVCTFCIVPITRGAEVSMPAREVYREASRLVGEGVKWITLLGQNVNSYTGSSPIPMIGDRKRLSNSTFERADVNSYRGDGLRQPSLRGSDPNVAEAISESKIASSAYRPSRNDVSTFPDLLEKLCQIDGLERISFTTSHPSDATEELFQVIARNPKISRRFHLPLQSGSDRMLKRMKRLHTYTDYKAKIMRLRELVPDISITTDIIAGFSGEEEGDHEATRRALREIRYDGAYIYKYSVRPATPAVKLEDDVPHSIKEERNRELLTLQKRIAFENNRSWLGRTVEVFVEGQSPKRREELIGRTLHEKKVVFPGRLDLIGTFQRVKLLEIKNETFIGDYEGRNGSPNAGD